MTSCQWRVCCCVSVAVVTLDPGGGVLWSVSAPQLEFTQSDDFRLIGIEQAFTLPFETLLRCWRLVLLGSERGEIVLFALRPGLVELR